jgi:hypothetical protein
MERIHDAPEALRHLCASDAWFKRREVTIGEALDGVNAELLRCPCQCLERSLETRERRAQRGRAARFVRRRLEAPATANSPAACSYSATPGGWAASAGSVERDNEGVLG